VLGILDILVRIRIRESKLGLTDLDPAPDPATFVCVLLTKNYFFNKFFVSYFLKYIYIIYNKSQSSKKKQEE
jgi:hypothetical protein